MKTEKLDIDPLFHLFFLDDELSKGGVNEVTFLAGLRAHVVHDPDAIQIFFTRSPEQYLAEIRSKAGIRPIAAVMDCNLSMVVDANAATKGSLSYKSEGGGFNVWADLVGETHYLPAHFQPFAAIFTGKHDISKIYSGVQPDTRPVVLRTMKPIVLIFESPGKLVDPTPVMKYLLAWIQDSRTQILQRLSPDDLRAFRIRAAKGDWTSVHPTALPGCSPIWFGTLAGLFPEYYGRVSRGERSEEILREVQRELTNRLPHLLRLVGELLTTEIAQWLSNSRLVPLHQTLRTVQLPTNLKSLDHIRSDGCGLDAEPYTCDAAPALRTIATDLEERFWEALKPGGLSGRYGDRKSGVSAPRGLLTFLRRLQAPDAAWAVLHEIIDGIGKRDLAGRIPKEDWQRLSKEEKRPAGVAFLGEKAETLLEQFTNALERAGSWRNFRDEPWQEFLTYFPLPEEAGTVIGEVIAMNRRSYGQKKDVVRDGLAEVDYCPAEWHTAIVKSSAFSGRFTLFILARTQLDHKPPLKAESDFEDSLRRPMKSQKLIELREMICGQYGGRIHILQGIRQITISSSEVKEYKLNQWDVLSFLDEDTVETGVSGTWYLIEIGSQEWDA